MDKLKNVLERILLVIAIIVFHFFSESDRFGKEIAAILMALYCVIPISRKEK